MPNFQLQQQDSKHYFIEGELTFSSINNKTMPNFDFLKQATEIHIDLKKVKTADSAGLALLLEWLKFAKKYHSKLKFDHIPHQILTLAALSGLDFNHDLTDISHTLQTDTP